MQLLALAALLAPTADAAPLKPAMVTAKSEYPPQNGVTYVAGNAADGKASTPWTEGDEAGSGLGQFIEYDFGQDVDISSFQIWNGSWASYDLWSRQNRVKELELTFSDGSKQKFELGDEMVSQVVRLDKPVKTSTVRATIKSVHNGTTFTDTPISELIFHDDRRGDFIPVTGWSASSVYPADADGNYEPVNLEDTLKDTMWCEGNKDGDGTGEWLKADFGGPYTVSAIDLINGNGGDMKYWMKANRVTAVTLSFSDGSTQRVEVKNSFLAQTISISPVQTSSVKVSFDEVAAGKEFNDLCLSELRFKE